jgi:uncharacterized ferritin-like protein (DUF455 family)
MAWALLAFPCAPKEFRAGVLGIFWEEISHLQLYRDYLAKREISVGYYPVRDWFWSRIPLAQSPADFVALMGIGFEGGNLDHSLRYAAWFREVEDEEGARIQEEICRDEVGHVRFAVHWFREFTGGLDFESWRSHLPAPLTPTVCKGRPLNRKARLEAGLDQEFLERLEHW